MTLATALRVHREGSLGKANQECEQLRDQFDAARQNHAELALQKALLDTEITDLKLRLEKALQAVPPPVAPPPLTPPPTVPPQAARPEQVPTPPVPPVHLPASLTPPAPRLLSAGARFHARNPLLSSS